MAAFDVRRQELVGKEVNRLKEGTNLLNELLSSMNLPAALEDTTGGGVPASIQEKSAAVIQVFTIFLKNVFFDHSKLEIQKTFLFS